MTDRDVAIGSAPSAEQKHNMPADGTAAMWQHGMAQVSTVAHDVREVLQSHLGIQEPVGVVGHDIGLMTAYAYAQAFQEDVTHLVVIDAPLPGTAVFDRLRSDPRLWHFAFHAARDVAEMLVAGREREYLRAFFNARIADPSAITETDLNEYVAAYSAAGLCALVSSCTGHSIETWMTIAPQSHVTANCVSRCSRSEAR